MSHPTPIITNLCTLLGADTQQFVAGIQAIDRDTKAIERAIARPVLVVTREVLKDTDAKD